MEENTEVAPFTHIGIVGLGLIGGSLALACKRLSYHVSGFDTNAKTVQAARAQKIDASTRPDCLFEVDLLFVALYPNAAIDFMTQNAQHFHKGCLIVDCCGVKAHIFSPLATMAKEHDLFYIGGHPMAGSEHGGFAAATADLFQNSNFLLTPANGQTKKRQALNTLLYRIGVKHIVSTTPTHHDRMIAFTSQLPHALACAYVMSSSCPDSHGYSAGSYRDVSRVAHINPPLWAELFLENKEAFLAEADELILHMQALRDAVSSEDRDKLTSLLQMARERKDKADSHD